MIRARVALTLAMCGGFDERGAGNGRQRSPMIQTYEFLHELAIHAEIGDGVCEARSFCGPFRQPIVMAEKELLQGRARISLRHIGEQRRKELRGRRSFGAVDALPQYGVEPGNINLYRTLRHAPQAAGAEFAKARVEQRFCASFPGTADPSGIRFASKGLA